MLQNACWPLSGSFSGDCWHRNTYDALDNLKSWTLPGVREYADYQYSARNLPEQIKDSAGTTVVSQTFDPQGNLSAKNGQAYHFDFGNRLREVVGKQWSRYDGYGHRVLRWEATEPGIVSLYSLDNQLLYDDNNRASSRTGHLFVYLQGSLLATKERNLDSGAERWTYQHTDALGSPVAITDPGGSVIERTDWEPWGHAIGKPNLDSVGYTGHQMDGSTQLIHMQQRYYDPDTGQFLSQDPVNVDINTGNNFNRRWYAANNPYRFKDPDGREINGQFHPVVPGLYHLSLRVTPDNQAAYQNDSRFITDSATGQRYLTLGAGPQLGEFVSFPDTSISRIPGLPWIKFPTQVNLVSDINRPADSNRASHPRSNDLPVTLPSKYKNEDSFIKALLSADARYKDNVKYGLPGTNGFNSNSYINGLLESVGAKRITPPVAAPMHNHPLPKKEFDEKNK